MEARRQTEIKRPDVEVRQILDGLNRFPHLVAVGKQPEIRDALVLSDTAAGKQFDRALSGNRRVSETAGRPGRGIEQAHGRGNAHRLSQHIHQRIDDNVIQDDNDRELHEKRQATAVRAEVLLRVHLLNFPLNLLHRHLVVSARILLADRHFLRTKFRLLDGVLLLFDCKRGHQRFHKDRKDADTDNITAESEIGCQPIEEIPDAALNRIEQTGTRRQINGSLEQLHQLLHVCNIQIFVVRLRNLVAVGSFAVCSRNQRLCRRDDILVGFHVVGAYFAVVKPLGGHIIPARRGKQHIRRLEILRVVGV